MNILLVSREFPPFRGGGIGTYTEHAARALTDAGHRAVVLTVSHDGTGSCEPHGSDQRVLVHRLPLVMGEDWSRPAPAIDSPETRAMFEQLGPWSVLSRSVALALPGIVREHGIDVVEAPECGALLWWTLNDRWIGRKGPERADGSEPLFVVHVHSPNEWIDRENRQAAPRRASLELRHAERESARRADVVICPSRDLAAWVGTSWRVPRVHVVPYPLGSIAVAADPGRHFEGSVRVLLVGRMEPRKGVDVLLRAMVIAARRGLDIRVLLAGQDTIDARTGAPFGRRSLNTIVPVAMRSRVQALGKLGPEGLAAARQDANIAAAPGAFDNFPYAAMESMACGLPMLAPRFGGVSELVRDRVDGLLFEPHDAADLARAMLAYGSLGARECAAMGRSAAARVGAFCANVGAVRERERLFSAALAERAEGRTGHVAETLGVAFVGTPNPDLARIVASGRAAYAVGWTGRSKSASTLSAGLTPTLAAHRDLRTESVALREDLLHLANEALGSSPDASDLIEWLIAEGREGAIDPSVNDHACSGPTGNTEAPAVSSLAHDVEAFRSGAPIRMARRTHPFPWPVVRTGPSATP